jgi:hypothetical protein
LSHEQGGVVLVIIDATPRLRPRATGSKHEHGGEVLVIIDATQRLRPRATGSKHEHGGEVLVIIDAILRLRPRATESKHEHGGEVLVGEGERFRSSLMDCLYKCVLYSLPISFPFDLVILY